MEELDEIQELNDLTFQPQSNIKADEHRSFNNSILDYLRGLQQKFDLIEEKVNKYTPKNRGYFSGYDAGGGNVGQGYSVFGDIVSAVLVQKEQETATVVDITMANPIPSLNYYVRVQVQSLGVLFADNDFILPVYTILSSNKFRFSLGQDAESVQNARIHLEILEYL